MSSQPKYSFWQPGSILHMMTNAMSKNDRTLLVGIDEAGYGPLLGPLVVSASAFEVPSEQSEVCLWDALHRTVSRSRGKGMARIPILDSKKLYHRSEGLGRLERSVLSVTSTWRDLPTTMRAMLRVLSPEVLSQLDDYPWYRDADPPLPRSADLGGIRIAAGLLRRNMAQQSIRLAGCWAEVLPEGHYNRLVNSTQNKAVVLLGLVLSLIHRVAQTYPHHVLHIFVDKQGARDHYVSPLMRAFRERRLKVLTEGAEHSAYEMTCGPSMWHVQFCRSGESQHLPIALASMIGKYLRELMMECFNDYWAAHVQPLRPTAGYYQDGMRFLRDIHAHIHRLGIERNTLVRCR